MRKLPVAAGTLTSTYECAPGRAASLQNWRTGFDSSRSCLIAGVARRRKPPVLTVLLSWAAHAGAKPVAGSCVAMSALLAHTCPASVMDGMTDFESVGRGSIPRRGTDGDCPWSVVDLARDPAKVEAWVRFPARALTRRWSQKVRRLPAKQFQAGSIPAGVSYKQGFDVVWTSGARFIPRDLNRCVPDMDSEDDDVVTVSSEGEHQTVNLESRVRLPYHTANLRELAPPGARASTTKPAGGGRLSDRPPVGLPGRRVSQRSAYGSDQLVAA